MKYGHTRAGKGPSFARLTLGLATGFFAGVLGLLFAAGYRHITMPQVKLQQVDTTNIKGNISQWRTVRMRVTAYCPCVRCCGRFADGFTASGHLIKQGDYFVAADKKYPFGTEIVVPGYNDGQPIQVVDRGRVIKGDRLDVFFASHTKAAKWGVKYLDVKVKTD